MLLYRVTSYFYELQVADMVLFPLINYNFDRQLTARGLVTFLCLTYPVNGLILFRFLLCLGPKGCCCGLSIQREQWGEGARGNMVGLGDILLTSLISNYQRFHSYISVLVCG